MRLELEPPVGVAGIWVGSRMREAHQRMQSLPGLVSFDGILARYQSDLFIRAFSRGDSGVVHVVEVSRDEYEYTDTVAWRGIDLLGEPADELIRKLAVQTDVAITEHGHSLTCANLLIALWRPTMPEGEFDEEGRYFRTALVAAPGLYE